jgi:poly(beta-D-mannuronate) lyase
MCKLKLVVALLFSSVMFCCSAVAYHPKLISPDFDFEGDSLNSAPQGLAVAGPVVVSNDRARSGSRSVRMTRTVSGENVRMRRNFGASASGRAEFSVYVPATVTADTYISLFQDSYSVNPDRVIDLMLRPNGDIRNRESGGQVTIGSYSLGAWTDVEILWNNLPSSTHYTLILNGSVVGSFPAERTGKTPARFEIKYGASTSDVGPSSVYIDRVSVGGGDSGTYSFDLERWKITLPDGSERTTQWLLDGNTSANEFYYNSDGSMVFRSPNIAGSTSGSNYSRTELREMLRGTNTSIPTQGLTKNNWVISTSSASTKSLMGGIDGNMKASLRVDHVSTTGEASKVGRVIIGQIHASNDEPFRLYYRKLPDNSKGAIYFAHETPGGGDTWYEMIGSRSNSASNPADGITLGEQFSYEVDVQGRQLVVTISRSGKADLVQSITMNAAYNDDWMYFKAGVYNQNNSGSSADYAQATFFNISVSHD